MLSPTEVKIGGGGGGGGGGGNQKSGTAMAVSTVAVPSIET